MYLGVRKGDFADFNFSINPYVNFYNNVRFNFTRDLYDHLYHLLPTNTITIKIPLETYIKG